MNNNIVDKKLQELRTYAEKNYIPVLKVESAELLKKLLIEKQPQRILEVGTSIGTSGILALSVTQANLVTIEKDEETLLQAKSNFSELNLIDRAQLILGDCFETLMFMSGEFDFIVLDGPKGHNKELTEIVFPLLKESGIIFVDNINFHDKIKVTGHIPHKHRTIVRNMRDFIDYINNNDKMKVTHYDIGDGIAIIEKKI